MTEAKVILDVWDYVMLSVVVAISSLVGFFHVFRRKDTNTKEFLVAGKSLGFIPIVLSTVATAISAISLQGYPLEIYMYGIQFVFLSLSPFLSITLFAHLFLPVFFNMGISSVFEYLEYRFNRTIRMVASIIYTFQLILYTSCVIYAPSLALNQVTGLHLWASVIGIGVICIFYTALGGIKAVIWADVVQLMVIIIAVFVVLGKACYDMGGIGEVVRKGVEGGRLTLYWYPDPASRDTAWTYIIGGALFTLISLAPSQMFIQRFLSNKSVARARWSLYSTCIILTCVMVLFAIIGLVMYAKYADCDPFLNGEVTSRDQYVPMFAVQTLSFIRGFPGIFVAGVLCATLSTLSSSLNALSAIALTDYVKPFYPGLTDKRAMMFSKLLAAGFGAICIALVALAENMGGVIRAAFSIAGAVGGPLFASFALGVIFPWANPTGALCGFAVSLSIGVWATIGSLMSVVHFPHAPLSVAGCVGNSTINVVNETIWNLSGITSMFNDTDLSATVNETLSLHAEEVLGIIPPTDFFLYTMSPIWYGSFSSLIGITVGLTVSLLTGVQDPEKLDPRLICPSIERLCRSLPEKYRIFLGYKSDQMKLGRWDMESDNTDKEKKVVEMKTIQSINGKIYVEVSKQEEVEKMPLNRIETEQES